MNIGKIVINTRDLLASKSSSMDTHNICTEFQRFLDSLMKLTYRSFECETLVLDHLALYRLRHKHWNGNQFRGVKKTSGEVIYRSRLLGQ